MTPSNRRPRGATLAMVLTLMLVMVILVAGLHQYEVLARRKYTEAEADLQFYVARRWNLAERGGQAIRGARRWSPVSTTPGPRNSTGFFMAQDGVPTHLAARLFERTDQWKWGGLPDCRVALAPDIPEQNRQAQPMLQDWTVAPKTLGPNTHTFQGSSFREVYGYLPPYYASAPHGHLRLDSAQGWMNPALGDALSPLAAFSGDNVRVAAGQSVQVGRFPQGTAYCTHADGIKIQEGLAFPRVVSRLPVPGYEQSLLQDITSVRDQLRSTATKLSNRTDFLSRPAPSASAMLDLLLDPPSSTDDFRSRMSMWWSLESSINFPFPTIPLPPDFKPVTRLPLLPVQALITLYPPYPTDGGDNSKEQEILEKIKAGEKELEAIRRRIQDLERDYRRIAGEMEMKPLPYSMEDEPAFFGIEPLYRLEMDYGARHLSIRDQLRQDRQAVQRAVDSNQPGLVSGLSLSREFLIFLGAYADYRRRHNADPHVISDEGELTPNPQGAYKSNLAILALMNYGLMDRLSYSEGVVTVPDAAHPGKTRKEIHMTVSFDGKPVTGGKEPLDDATWHRILDVVNPALLEFPAGSTRKQPVGESYLQLLLLNSLDVEDEVHNPEDRTRYPLDPYQHPWKQCTEELKGIPSAIHAEEYQLQQTIERLEAEFAQYNALADKSIPQVRKDQPRDTNGKVRTLGQPGTCRARFGYSWDLFYNLIRDIAKGDFSRKFCPSYPLVFYGPEDRELHRGIRKTEQTLDLTSTFTVPPGKTFHFNGNLMVAGDVWLQRGSTLSLGGDLTVRAQERTDPIMPHDELNPFNPCGRLILEEGSSLLVSGSLHCQGTHERASVIVCAPAQAIHPITSAIMCGGRVVLPHGMRTGVALCDYLQDFPDGLTLGFLNSNLEPFMSRLAPGAAKTCGPFQKRAPFFCQFAPRWLFAPPVMMPAPPLEKTYQNRWVLGYKILSLLETYSINAHLGENLYMQADYWPIRMRLDNVGVAPVLPKKPRSQDETFYAPGRLMVDSDMLDKALETGYYFAYDFLIGAFKTKILACFVSFPEIGEKIADTLSEDIDRKDRGEEIEQPLVAWGRNREINFQFDRLTGKVMEWLIPMNDTQLEESFLRSVAGVLVYGQEIEIGMDQEQARAALGMFVAEHDVNLNARYTVGSVYSIQGSINSNTQAHTNLLAYPLFTRASLYMANPDPPYDGWLGKLPNDLKPLYDNRYGEKAPKGSGIDVNGRPTFQITAEGWQ